MGWKRRMGRCCRRRSNSGVHVVTKANIDSPAMQGLLDPKKYKLTPFLGE